MEIDENNWKALTDLRSFHFRFMFGVSLNGRYFLLKFSHFLLHLGFVFR